MKGAFEVASCTLLLLAAGACSTLDSATDLNANAPVIGDPNPDGKPPGEGCAANDDCRTGVCAQTACQASSNTDAVKNGDETDVDCGGAAGPGCANGKACASAASCASGNCAGYRCSADGANGNTAAQTKAGALPDLGQIPTFTDGIKNGTETDVDCGGPAEGKRCAVGKACAAHADCESNGCTALGTCARRASCTQLAGGQTCGPNDDMTRQNDCCESAAVGAFTVDRYLVTAGRMRAFLGRLDGKVRDWATTLGADRWNQRNTAQLPNTIGESNTQLGPFYGKRSCETGYHTGHTYWTPSELGDTKDFSQDVLDTKALNCVPWSLVAALCAFDGGHLATEAELRAAYTNNGTTSFPWGARGSYRASTQSSFAVQEYSYVTAGNAPKNADGFFDIAANIAPPGRRPDGYNATGHADLVGNLLEWVSDRESQFIWKGSFERHAAEADKIEGPINEDPYMARDRNGDPWYWSRIGAQDDSPNGYYALGGRCAY
jgi:formylglycine-generating enzyme required for sulfatase activity